MQNYTMETTLLQIVLASVMCCLLVQARAPRCGLRSPCGALTRFGESRVEREELCTCQHGRKCPTAWRSDNAVLEVDDYMTGEKAWRQYTYCTGERPIRTCEEGEVIRPDIVPNEADLCRCRTGQPLISKGYKSGTNGYAIYSCQPLRPCWGRQHCKRAYVEGEDVRAVALRCACRGGTSCLEDFTAPASRPAYMRNPYIPYTCQVNMFRF